MNRFLARPAVCQLLLSLLVSSGDLFAQSGASDEPALFTPVQIDLPVAPFRGYREIRTEHFTIVYEPIETEAATKVAGFAESVYAKLAQFLGSQPAHITCVLIGRADFANGYFTPLPPHHMALYIDPPDTPDLGARGTDWLRELFTHELTHYVHLTYERGVFHSLSRVFGPTISAIPGAFVPGWEIEGLAVYAETAFSDGGRGRSPYFELYYRSLVMDHAMFPLSHAGYDSYEPPAGREYIAGYLIINYLMSHFGQRAFREIQHQFVRYPLAGLDPAVQKVTGMSLRQIYEAVLSELSRKYRSFRTLPVGTRVSPIDGEEYYLPQPTARGLYVYRTGPGRLSQILLVDPHSGAILRTVNVQLTDPSAFSSTADGRLLVFSSFGVDATVAGGPSVVSDLYLYNNDTNRIVRLTWNAHLIQPAISPDGRWIVALQHVGLHRSLVKFALRSPAAGIQPKLELLYSRANGLIFNPVFSPDGTHIAFTLNVHGAQNIVRASLADLPPRALADMPVSEQQVTNWNNAAALPAGGFHEGEEYYPSYVNNHTLLYTADYNGSLELYERDTRSGSVTRVLEDRVGARRGVVTGGGFLYESLTAHGSTLFFQGGQTTEPTAIPDRPRISIAEADKPIETAASEPHREFPVPDYWIPLPFLTTDAANSPILGAGILTGGATAVGDISWNAQVGIYPSLLQPFGALGFTFSRGMFSVQYQLTQSYAYSSSGTGRGATQSTSQTLSFGLTPIATSDLQSSDLLSFTVGTSFSVELRAPGDFSFAGGSAPSKSEIRYATVGAGAFYVRNERYPDAMIYPAGRFSAFLAASTILPLFGQAYEGVFSQAGLSVSMRGLSPLHSLSLGLSASYASGAVPNFSSLAPEGFTQLPQAAPGPGTPGIAMATVRYGMTLLTTDQPVIFESGLVGLGASLFAAYRAGFDPGLTALGPSSSGIARIVPSDRVIAGIDLTLMFARNTIIVPFRIGVAVRFDPTFRLPPAFPADYGFFVSFDGATVYQGPNSSGSTVPSAAASYLQYRP